MGREPTVPGDLLVGIHVLVVEDNPDARELFKTILEYAGALVSVASGAEQALRMCEQLLPDVVLTDIAMPEMDGWTLLKRLRERRELDATPIVALTAFPATERHGEESGFDRYLRKPIDPFELTEKLSELLKRSA